MMMQSNMGENYKKYSFKDFLTKETYVGVDPETEEEIMGVISRIEIPMIQRDYAQGRVKEYKDSNAVINDTGSRFLKAIFNSLKSDSEMELEFIYGSVEERDVKRSSRKDYVYIPLDGQQRLTTLFLLYWYCSMRELPVETGERTAMLKLLSKFTYLTRTSSRIFCESICDPEKMESIHLGCSKVSALIENCPWYYKEYRKDPTVKAMLAMLDHIDVLYNSENPFGVQYLPRLEKLTFFVFPLNKYKLTEDLYIKMNARGKQLSSYENFKADLINWMKSAENPQADKFGQEVTYRGRKMKYYMSFAQKLDNEWTDIFWNAKENSSGQDVPVGGKAVDAKFMCFFMRFFFNERILALQKLGIPDDLLSKDDVVDYFWGNGVDASVSYSSNDFEDKYQKCLSYEAIKQMETFLDAIIPNIAIVNDVFVPSWLKQSKSADSFYMPSITWQGRIVFHAIKNYFVRNQTFNELYFRDWVRVVWNFVVDPTIRNYKDNVGTLRFIDDLSAHSENIIEWLSQTPEGSRLKTQYAEEHIKAKLVLKDEKWRELLVNGEHHPLLKGRILFLLEENEDTEIEKYKQYLEIAKLVIPSDKKSFLWIRALLTHFETYEFSGVLTLSDIRENWKTSLSDNLRVPMQKLLREINSCEKAGKMILTDEDVRKYMHDLCANYHLNPEVEWVYPLVAWEDEDGNGLLSTYSETQKIEKCDDDGQVYLYYKTRFQPESCILLTSLRDKLISNILPYIDADPKLIFEWPYSSYQCSVHDVFFRGKAVTLLRTVQLADSQSLVFAYTLTAEKIEVGVRYKDNLHLVNDDDQKIWLCSKSYDIRTIAENEMDELVQTIESEVFSLENDQSVASRLSVEM